MPGHAAPGGADNSGEPAAPFRPKPPTDLNAAGMNSAQLEALVLKFLLAYGVASGRRIAHELGLPFALFPEFLRVLQVRKFVAYSNALTANDFEYMLTELGRGRAVAYMEECAYVGTAPVPFADYVAACTAQTIANQHPKQADLRRAFADLLISQEMFRTLGPAINAGKGMFLYGQPGNGKTSIAERVTACFGPTVWIPRVLEIEGQIVKLFDPASHEVVTQSEDRATNKLRGLDYDARWVEIVRPTITAGGELTMENLEIRFDPKTRISEAPLQMKSNNGTFLIDDFGRQRMPTYELLNRWIIPLEKRYDFLTLANGKKIRVPFDQLIIFSTNLEPHDLVDEAFLRRIPYKIMVADPNEQQFRQLIAILAPKLGFPEVDPDALNHLIATHFYGAGRPFRYCHPRDLLLQVRNNCLYNELPLKLTPQAFDTAAENYFTVSPTGPTKGSGTCAMPVKPTGAGK